MQDNCYRSSPAAATPRPVEDCRTVFPDRGKRISTQSTNRRRRSMNFTGSILQSIELTSNPVIREDVDGESTGRPSNIPYLPGDTEGACQLKTSRFARQISSDFAGLGKL